MEKGYVAQMALLHDLKPGALVTGLLPGGVVTIIDVKIR
jgi:hypothetical protein